MKDKKRVLIIIVIFILLVLAFYIIKKNSITFTLVGDNNISIQYGTIYSDQGFIAKDGFGKDLSSYVSINGNVNTLIPGAYIIYYELNYNNKYSILDRIVKVENVDLNINDLDIVLNGNEETYLLKGSIYKELGAEIYSKIDNTKVNVGNLFISSNIDNTKVGEYNVVYNLNYKNKSVTKTRKVSVFDIKYDIAPTELTNKDVRIILDLNNIKDYDKMILPDGSISNNRDIEYVVNSNGEYSFIINLLNNETFTKIIEVDNIVDNYICKGELTSTGTRLMVSPSSSSIKEYKWITANEIVNGNSTYEKNKAITSASVRLTFNNDKTYTINCNIEDKLVYHFKYDENNTKPYMSCNTYTSADKARLDAKLKQAIQEAGYGTRAGVVAAARFLVGGLDYKVYYQGPKTVNTAIGRYQSIGLNIGQKGAWGCNVSGYTQGMDCTNFVSWAFLQNGIRDNPYKDKSQQVKVRTVINQLKPGDLLYSPCSGECKNDMGLSHVGIIVGIDDKNIYVAESTTGTIDAIIITKWEKYNMPTHGKFSIGHIYKYKTEGNLTNMWMS